MANKKITQLASAEATVAAIFPVVVSGANQQLGLRDLMTGLGIPQYIEATCRATATAGSLPADSNIFDIYIKPLAGSSANNGGSNVNIGIGTDATYYAVIQTSALGASYFYRAGTDHYSLVSRLIKASGAVVIAAPTATANASFVVGIGYFRV